MAKYILLMQLVCAFLSCTLWAHENCDDLNNGSAPNIPSVSGLTDATELPSQQELTSLRNAPNHTIITLTNHGNVYTIEATSLTSKSADSIFSKSLDFNQYSSLKIPGVDEAVTLPASVIGGKSEGKKTVWFHTDLHGVDAKYFVEVSFGKTQGGQQIISWHLTPKPSGDPRADTGNVRQVTGSWFLDQLNPNETLIRYRLNIDPVTSAPHFLINRVISDRMKTDYDRMIQAFTL